MQIQIDFRSDTPAYLQIINQIQHRIVTGELQPEDQLPTVRQLANELQVNFNTVARSYRILDEAGLISTQHGRGTYVLPRPEESMDQRRQRALQGVVSHFLADAARLELTPEEVRDEIQRQIQKGRINDNESTE